MKKLTNCILAAIWIGITSLNYGCMSDREYRLRKKEIEAKANHPKTYDVITITGPFEMKEGAKLVATSPTQPWNDTKIPDGQDIQRAVIRDLVTGAIIGYGFYRIGHPHGGNTTNNTTNNYNAAPGE